LAGIPAVDLAGQWLGRCCLQKHRPRVAGWSDILIYTEYIRIPKMPRTEHGKNEYLAATAGRDYLVKDLVKTHSKTFKTGAKRSESSA